MRQTSAKEMPVVSSKPPFTNGTALEVETRPSTNKNTLANIINFFILFPLELLMYSQTCTVKTLHCGIQIECRFMRPAKIFIYTINSVGYTKWRKMI